MARLEVVYHLYSGAVCVCYMRGIYLHLQKERLDMQSSDPLQPDGWMLGWGYFLHFAEMGMQHLRFADAFRREPAWAEI